MKTDSTGIAARMMLSLDRERICECLLSHRQLQSTPLQVRYPQGVRDALGIMSEQLSLSVSDLGSQGCPWYHERTAFSFRL